eukprot:401604-Amorphochlora_amoeboformis.AAC.3
MKIATATVGPGAGLEAGPVAVASGSKAVELEAGQVAELVAGSVVDSAVAVAGAEPVLVAGAESIPSEAGRWVRMRRERKVSGPWVRSSGSLSHSRSRSRSLSQSCLDPHWKPSRHDNERSETSR